MGHYLNFEQLETLFGCVVRLVEGQAVSLDQCTNDVRSATDGPYRLWSRLYTGGLRVTVAVRQLSGTDRSSPDDCRQVTRWQHQCGDGPRQAEERLYGGRSLGVAIVRRCSTSFDDFSFSRRRRARTTLRHQQRLAEDSKQEKD